MRFEFATAARIVFGSGVLRELGGLAREMGTRALLVTGRGTDRAERVQSCLSAGGVSATVFACGGEPTTDAVLRGVACAREEHCELVIGFGGGSPMDAAKAIAALVTNPGDLFDYLEVIGRGQPLLKPALPLITVPTTAGTGTEVTRNAVLASSGHQQKVSLRSPFLLPRLALVDPVLTVGLPPGVTAATGLDALTQLIEPYVSLRANPMTDALCVEGMERSARSLRRAAEQGGDLAAREDLSAAALFSGLALANAGLGAVHGFAAPLGGMFSAPHGAVCAALLPHVMAANVRALREREPSHPALPRFDQVARLLTGCPHAAADDGVAWVRQLCADLHIPALKAYGIRPQDLPTLVEKSVKASSMKANPIVLTPQELGAILQEALG